MGYFILSLTSILIIILIYKKEKKTEDEIDFLIKRENTLTNIEMYLRNKIKKIDRWIEKEQNDENRYYLLLKRDAYNEIEEKIKEFGDDK